MTEVIVDTNVAVVANKQNSSVVATCVDACMVFITTARNQHIVLMDDGDAIRQEYAQALQQSRPYGLGALFLQHVYQYQYDPTRVRRVPLAIAVDGGYADFPNDAMLANFDISDRKFAALARKTGVPVTNATDSDWADNIATLNAHGIAVDFLCGQNKTSWFTP
ncbi:hypothetical protein SAMN02990966_07448 [Rhodospirillales bacterium URHD0017]|nr:hypothetical protein SAMN02990966_07448 [Rhodospirillales bacterium URHD0017]